MQLDPRHGIERVPRIGDPDDALGLRTDPEE